ncbi:hypothetical protein BT69DRAFT_1270783 [Atractiella rhizophila]|nr:hypothetical protein BT69DRAFT_1270783 [Atractiella rhizophila]
MEIHPPSASAPPLPDLAKLAGKWHVVSTSLPMWKSKKNVSISYTVLPDGTLDDLVEYHSSLSSPPETTKKTVRGVDRVVHEGHAKFQWRGTGWLKLFTSDWQLLALSDDGEIAVTYFSKTLFTPEGIDIYARDLNVDEDKWRSLLERLKKGEADEKVKTLAETAFDVVHDR